MGTKGSFIRLREFPGWKRDIGVSKRGFVEILGDSTAVLEAFKWISEGVQRCFIGVTGRSQRGCRTFQEE